MPTDATPWTAALLTALQAGGLLAVIAFLPGAMAARLLLRRAENRSSLMFFATALACGFVLSVFTGWLLAEAGLLRPWIHVAWSMAVAATLALGAGRRGGWSAPLVSTAGFALSVAVLLLIPHRGEWAAGGWDPGLYVNSGMQIGRTGGTAGEESVVYRHMPDDVRKVLLRDFGGVTESFPGIPVDAAGHSPPPMFRGTPVWIAVAYEAGDAPLAFRATELAGAMALVVFAGMLCAFGLGWPMALAAAGLLALQPIYLYHLHTPCSEIPEFLLTSAAVLGWGLRRTAARPAAALIFLALLLATLNRLSFALFGATILAALAVVDEPEPAGTGRRLAKAGLYVLWGLAIALGAAADVYRTPTACARLWHVLPLIMATAGGLLVFAGAWVTTGASGFAVIRRVTDKHLRTAAAAALGAFLVYLAFGSGAADDIGRNAGALVPFLGAPILAVACIGVAIVLGRNPVNRPLLAIVLAFAACSLVVMRFKHMADLYPWCTKRYLPFLAPLLALFAALTVTAAKRRAGMVATVLVAVVALPMARPAWHAWRTTEYDGLWAELGEACSRIDRSDIVVTDHFKWGVPLKMALGLDVVNGERLWSCNDTNAVRRTLDFLVQRATAEHRRLIWLTSTSRGLAVYPVQPDALDLHIGPPDDWHYSEVVHSAKARSVATKSKSARFAIFLQQDHLESGAVMESDRKATWPTDPFSGRQAP